VIDPNEIVAARCALGRLLAKYRLAAGLNQHELAPHTHYGRSTVANVETGRQNVPRSFWERADAVLHANGMTAQYDQLEALVRRQRRELAEAETVERAADARENANAEAGVVGEHLPALVGDLVGIAQLRERVQHITAAYDTAPSVSLLAAAGQVQAQIIGLRERVPPGRSRRELYGAMAEASILMGQLVWDALQRRDHATALAHFDHAIDAAQQISDALAEAHALLRKSYVALYGVRRPALGLSLAAQAAQRSHGHSPTLAGVCLLHVAEAHGFLGDRPGCEQALEEAQVRLGQRDDLDAAADFFPPDQFGRLAGSCYLSLNLPGKAQAHLEQTADAMRDQQKVSAIVLGNLTLAYLRQRKLEEGTATLHAAIDEVERTRGGGGLNLVFAAGRELRPWRQEPAVQDVHDRLLTLMA
jgi:transcriptional regulator with XRE-family HTH domain